MYAGTLLVSPEAWMCSAGVQNRKKPIFSSKFAKVEGSLIMTVNIISLILGCTNVRESPIIFHFKFFLRFSTFNRGMVSDLEGI